MKKNILVGFMAVIGFSSINPIFAQDVPEEIQRKSGVSETTNLDLYALDSIVNLCNDLKRKKCYAILLIPVILNGSDDPLAVGKRSMSGNRIANIVEIDIPNFYNALKVSPKHVVDAEPGDQYELVFLMKGHGTTDEYRIQVRISGDTIILQMKSIQGNKLFVDPGLGFLQWLNEQSVGFTTKY